VEFNAMEAGQAAQAVRPCAAIESFVTALVARRPYPDPAALLRYAEARVATWTAAEVDDALRDHPRIGERHVGRGISAAMSRAEQAGVASDPDLAQRLSEANRRYEERFGQIYLVRAMDRSADELLSLLERRLANDDATEAAVVRQQLGEIALLRLAALFEDAG
jgi:2-oxo-4-hydroxy-4-carboxy-5-ureidoimidazoline decarboxylase